MISMRFFGKQFAIIGNFHTISTQIVFKTLEFIKYLNLQDVSKEVNVFVRKKSKAYGILSVLASLYDVEYLFTVDENVFFRQK
jgi:16S rRNA A1518/A1519 N6-dimethyltransferase RsmA/KsgA/DIM1 with predicted DNA glycosylase/AP lyase activity